jgi:hypothetical protein
MLAPRRVPPFFVFLAGRSLTIQGRKDVLCAPGKKNAKEIPSRQFWRMKDRNPVFIHASQKALK